MKSILFIVNPIPFYSNLFDEHFVINYFKNKPYKVFIKQTEYPKHAVLLAQNAVKNNINIVVSVGGDGTIHEIAQALVYTNTKLAIIPTGFSSAFPNYFQFPWQLNKCLDIILEEKTQQIDTIKIENALFGKVYGVGFVGMGMSANLVHSINQSTAKSEFYYWLKTIQIYRQKLLRKVQLKFNFSNLSILPYELLIANIDQYKSKMKYFKNTKIDDGILNILIVKKLGIYKFISFVINNLFTKQANHNIAIEFYKTEVIHLYVENETKIQIDFEPYKIIQDCTVTAEPLSLMVIIPNQDQLNKIKK